MHKEFVDYQHLRDEEIKDVLESPRLDSAWKNLSDLKSYATDEKRFENLFSIVESVLVIPHSNATSERIFSMISKNVTSTRSSLNIEETVGSIMIVKFALENDENFEPQRELQVKAKKACVTYNTNCNMAHQKSTLIYCKYVK